MNTGELFCGEIVIYLNTVHSSDNLLNYILEVPRGDAVDPFSFGTAHLCFQHWKLIVPQIYFSSTEIHYPYTPFLFWEIL